MLLRNFWALLQLVLAAAPRLLWWVLAALGLALINLLLHREIWPHTPGARVFFLSSSGILLLAVPWLLAHTAWCVSQRLRGWGWRRLWQMGAAAGYVGAIFSSILGLVGLVALLAGN